MRKVIAHVLFAVLILSSFSGTFAQKITGGRQSSKKLSVIETTRFAEAKAYSEGDGVFLQWEMAVESNNIGFFIYRIGDKGRQLVSETKMVEGSAARVGKQTLYGETYNFFDSEGGLGTPYVIESIMTDGKRIDSETVMPQYVLDLSSVAGSSPELARRSENNNGNLLSSDLTLTKEVINDMDSHEALADPDTHRWVISQPGVRIGVKKEGIYRVTRDQLQAGGFNVNTDPSLWQLYVEGVEQGIIVGGNGDYIEFYGKGIDTVETDIRMYYLLTGATAGKRMGSRVSRPSTSTLISTGYAQTFIRKERTNYLNDVLNGDAENYWGRPVGSITATVPLTLTGVDFTEPNSNMVVRLQGFSDGDHVVEVKLNGQTLPSVTGVSLLNYFRSYDIPTSMLLEGANSLQLKSIGPSGDFSFFDSVSVSFKRKFVSDQNTLKFFTQSSKAARLEGFASPNIRLFDTTWESEPFLVNNLNITATGSTFGFDLPAARPKKYFAVEDSAILSAVSITPNNPSLIGVPTLGANLVIITYKNFAVQAEQWANYRRGQGFTAAVIDVDDIYDEFNYGSLSSGSIRNFLQYAKTNWQTPPDYVLLIGDACYDSRNYEGLGFFNYVPTPIVNTLFTETASDESMADFNNDGLAEIPIGRIPARDTQTVTTMLNKTIAWENALTPTSMSRGALFASDQFDAQNNLDFAAMSVRVSNQLPPADIVPRTFIVRSDPDAVNTLIASMNTGKYVVNYTGHGTTGSWGGSNPFFSVNSVPLLTNANNQSIFTMLTCLNGYFHNLRNESLAEVLTKAPNGGAVAAWSSTGLTTPNIQEIMGKRFYNQIGIGSITRMGDLIKDAKTALNQQGADVRLSWALIGDPMLKVR